MGTQEDLANKLGIAQNKVSQIFAAYTFRKEHNISSDISTRAIIDTGGLSEEERAKILKKHGKGLIEAASIREHTRTVKEASEPVKEALLDVDVNPVIRANPLIRLLDNPGATRGIPGLFHSCWHSCHCFSGI